MPPSSETITGMAGETTVWLTAATSMPSISPAKITFLWEPLFPIFPLVLHNPGHCPEYSPEVGQFLLAQLLTDAVLEPLPTLPAALDQASSLPRGVQLYHPIVLLIPLPAQQAFSL